MIDLTQAQTETSVREIDASFNTVIDQNCRIDAQFHADTYEEKQLRNIVSLSRRALLSSLHSTLRGAKDVLLSRARIKDVLNEHARIKTTPVLMQTNVRMHNARMRACTRTQRIHACENKHSLTASHMHASDREMGQIMREREKIDGIAPACLSQQQLGQNTSPLLPNNLHGTISCCQSPVATMFTCSAKHVFREQASTAPKVPSGHRVNMQVLCSRSTFIARSPAVRLLSLLCSPLLQANLRGQIKRRPKRPTCH